MTAGAVAVPMLMALAMGFVLLAELTRRDEPPGQVVLHNLLRRAAGRARDGLNAAAGKISLRRRPSRRQ